MKKKKKEDLPDKSITQIRGDRGYYLANGILYVPKKARWEHFVKNANQPNIGKILDSAIEILEQEHPKQLKDVIPKVYAKTNLGPLDLAFLINTFSSIQFGLGDNHKDIFGRIYEYFLSKFEKG